MPESELSFDSFLEDVDPQYREFVSQTHEFMLKSNSTLKLTLAKNGYVVSYTYGKKKRVVMNFVFRKSGLVARIYGDYAGQYNEFLDKLPNDMKKSIEKAPACKRFEDPPRCSPKCVGYVFTLNGTQYQKCRYNCFMFPVNDESIPHINAFLTSELSARVTA